MEIMTNWRILNLFRLTGFRGLLGSNLPGKGANRTFSSGLKAVANLKA